MRRIASRRGLQAALLALAAIPIVTGVMHVVLGTDSVRDSGDATASVESEFRFLAVWWMGAGLFLASLARHVERRTLELRAVCALLFLGGVARAIGIVDDGRPHSVQVALMVVEFALPLLLVVWQARVARPAGRSDD